MGIFTCQQFRTMDNRSIYWSKLGDFIFWFCPGTYYFRLRMTYNGCSIYSNIIDLTVLPGTPPASPTASASPTSSCSPISFTLTASGCSGTLKWFNSIFGGTLLCTGSTYTTSYLNVQHIMYHAQQEVATISAKVREHPLP